MLAARLIGPATSPGSLVLDRQPEASTSQRPGFSSSSHSSSSLPAKRGRHVGPEGDELVWSGHTLVWSKGVQVYRQYTFDRSEEDIACALFATFPPGSIPSSAGGRSHVDLRQSDTFGPFHTSPLARWATPQVPPSTSDTGASTSKDGERPPAPALIVFLRTRAHIFFPTGVETPIHLPYPIEHAWPLPGGGIMVQRALNRRERRALARSHSVLAGMDRRAGRRVSILDQLGEEADGQGAEGREPRLAVLMRPSHQFMEVVEGSVRVDGDGYRLGHSDDIDADRSVLFCSGEDTPGWVLLHSRKSGQIIFTRRVKVAPTTPPTPPAGATTATSASPLTARTMRPSDILNGAVVGAQSQLPQPMPIPMTSTSGPAPLPPVSRPQPSLRRSGSSMGEDRRLSGLADPLDRSQRRPPRISRVSEMHAGPGELQRTLDPTLATPPAASSMIPGKRKARISAVEEKRRESGASILMREDTDAMPPRTTLHRADDWDWAEATMLMGLEKEEMGKSETVLDRIWAWTIPSGFNPETASMFISDDLSPTSMVINIHSPETRQLYTFQATLFTGDRWQISPRSAEPSLSAIPLISTRPNVLDTLTLDPDGSVRLITSFRQSIPVTLPIPAEGDDMSSKLASSLHMRLEGDERMASSEHRPAIIRLEQGTGSEFTVVLKSGEALRCSADYTIPNRPARAAMEILSSAWTAEGFFALKQECLVERSKAGLGTDGWTLFDRALRGLFGLRREEGTSTQLDKVVRENLASTDPVLARLAKRCAAQSGSTAPVVTGPQESRLDPALLPAAIMALHLVGQDCRLSLRSRADLRRVADLIVDMSAVIGRLDWWDYWMRIAPSRNTIPAAKRFEIDSSALDMYQQPPDILYYLSRRLGQASKPFPSPSNLFLSTSEFGSPDPCAQTALVCDIFARLGSNRSGSTGDDSSLEQAYATVELMVEKNLGSDWLADRPACIALPLLEAMKLCQTASKGTMSAGMCELIDRIDLKLRMQGGMGAIEMPDRDPGKTIPTVTDILRGRTSQKHLPQLSQVRFGSDMRLREVERIMLANRMRTVSFDPKSGSDAEIALYQQALANSLAQRTLAILVGKGIFEYGTHEAAITGIWEIPLIELSVKLSPSNVLLKAQIHGEHVDWPCFHNGASAGLSISADCEGIDSAWIVLNKPATLTPEHGGFLLGLGLTGHLRKIKTYHAFPYIDARHDFTSVGLLLGLACSYAGSEDALVTKSLSLHTHALLPLGSMPLNASPLVQSAALVGLGLTYAGSKQLRMAEVTLGEVGRKEMAGIDTFSDFQEAYSFSAAAAFGLIMLGRGGEQTSEVDRRMLGRLRRCIHGDGPDLRKGLVPIDTTITGPGSTLALALVYLKSNRADIRDILEIPTTVLGLDLVRPDLLLLRTFARGLIMWDSISPAMSWIEDQLPPFILSQVKGQKRVGGLQLSTDLAYINIVAGACLAIGLKYAGTASEMAHNNLMLLFHALSRSAGSGGMAYEAKIRRSAARQALNVVTIAICCVMSGTGELQVLRRLRIAHGQEGAGITYGTHMAMHMSVGLLFLGRGRYTLGTSNLAIAAMSIAFFPRFMHFPDDNRAYPQAFRHLWALAAEPRCLMARDVDSGETVYLPIKIQLREGNEIRSQHLISPTLIAPFESLVSIEVDSPRYWPIKYDFSDPTHRAALVRTRTIHVKRRAGHLDYNSDPKGNRSIFIRAGGITGFDLHYDLVSPAAPPSIPPNETLDLIKQHSPASHHAVLAGLMGGDTAYERFVRTILLECVTLDKPQMLGVYMGLMAPGRGSEGVRYVDMIKGYYAKIWDSAGGGGSAEKRISLIRPSFLNALLRQGGEAESGTSTEQAYLRGEGWKGGEGLAEALAREKVPAWPLINALKDRVRHEATRGGDPSMLGVRVREVARVYEAALARVWDLDNEDEDGESMVMDGGAAEAEGSGWRAESVGRAVQAWSGSMDGESGIHVDR